MTPSRLSLSRALLLAQRQRLVQTLIEGVILRYQAEWPKLERRKVQALVGRVKDSRTVYCWFTPSGHAFKIRRVDYDGASCEYRFDTRELFSSVGVPA